MNDDKNENKPETQQADENKTVKVHNPFEGGREEEITQEDLESIEKFKEAQTERD